jgi:peptidoglycan/LPS O-acetylase OafA/YrhL
MVVLFHVWSSRTAGAVDIFFVMSGYLLIGSLARQYEASGRVDLIRYCAGIVRRLVPAATVVLIATVILCVFSLPVTRWDRTLREAAASSVFAENLALIRYSADYLARDDATTPFQSGWAISTQVQVYVLIAIMMALVAAVRVGQGNRRVVVFSALAIVGLTSFAWACRSVEVNEAGAYFDSLARLWEFCAGGAAAVLLTRSAPSIRWRVFLGWLGLLMLLSTAWLLGLTRQFPAWASLWPVAGGLLMLVAGARPDEVKSAGVGRFLGTRPLTWIGNLSYGIYLWHGPIVVFFLLWRGADHLGLIDGLAVLCATIALAAASRSLIELRLSRWMGANQSDYRTLIKGIVAILIGVAVVGAWWWLKIEREAVETELQSRVSNPGGRFAPDHLAGQVFLVTPRPMVARYDLPDVYAGGCHAKDGDSTLSVCRFGPAKASVHIAVVGSSHSAHWLPAVQEIARRRGWRVSAWTKSSCLLGSSGVNNEGNLAPDCGVWNLRLLERLELEKPDVVVTLASFVGKKPERTPPEMVAAWRRLGQSHIRVLALRDTIWMPFDVPDCVETHGVSSAVCSVMRPAEQLKAPLGSWPDNVTVVDTRDWVCGPVLCPSVIGGVLVYRDRDHLTATFSKSLNGRLEPYLYTVASISSQTLARSELSPVS